jgi:DNA invertase Pin-like site-specific DNA recombinase
MNTITLPRAYSYIRFSTPEQLKGDSLRRQTELSVRYARDNGLHLDETLTFHDLGVSAFNKSNLRTGGQLRAFLDAIDQGIVLPGSYLLVESLDRISRAEILEALEVFTGILNRGITIVTLADNMVYSKDKANKQFTDLIISITIMSRAHEESLTKSRRLKEAWEAKRNNLDTRKLTRTCPGWLKLNEDRTEYELIPENVAIVRQIVDLMMSGMGKGSIAKKFNKEGIPSIGNKNKGQTWFPSYIVKIVNNRALIGEFQPMQVVSGKRVAAGEPISNYFPRVISDEQYALLQQLISDRGAKSGGNRGKLFPNLFSGFVKCAYCGSTMMYVNKGGDRSSHSRFLVCSKAKRGAGCYYLPWTYDDLEEAFIRLAKGIDFDRFIKEGADQTKTVRSIGEKITIKQAEREDIDKRKQNLIHALEGSALHPTSIIERIAEHQASIDAIDAEIAALRAELTSANNQESISKNTLEVVQELLDQLKTKSGEELYLLRARINENLRRVIRELVLYPGGTIHISDEVVQITQELRATGRYSDADIEKYAHEMLPTQPRKDDKYFVIKNRDRVLQMLKPDHKFPDILDTLMNNPELLNH